MRPKFDASKSLGVAGRQVGPTYGLCFGGSFNPIHNGHLLCAKAAALHRNFDRVVVIPSAQPPHKPQSAELASAADRFAMARLACEFISDDSVKFLPGDIEIAR